MAIRWLTEYHFCERPLGLPQRLSKRQSWHLSRASVIKVYFTTIERGAGRGNVGPLEVGAPILAAGGEPLRRQA